MFELEVLIVIVPEVLFKICAGDSIVFEPEVLMIGPEVLCKVCLPQVPSPSAGGPHDHGV